MHVKHARARKGGIVHPSLRCSQHLQVADVSQNLSAPVLHSGVVATPFTGATETARAALEVTAHSEDLLKNTGRDPAYACQFDHVTCHSQLSLSSLKWFYICNTRKCRHRHNHALVILVVVAKWSYTSGKTLTLRVNTCISHLKNAHVTTSSQSCTSYRRCRR